MAAQLNTISRKTATKTIKNWREYATKKLKFGKTDVPKAIFIPLVDIEQVVRDFKKYDPRKLSGIRIYFTKKYSMAENPDDLFLTCLVVPTVAGKKNKPTDTELNIDAIIKVPVVNNRKNSIAKTAAATDTGYGESIYDMTYPCPPICDGTTNWI